MKETKYDTNQVDDEAISNKQQHNNMTNKDMQEIQFTEWYEKDSENIKIGTPQVGTIRSQREWLEIHERVMEKANYNYKGAQIPINNTWNVELWESLLADYQDREIVQFIKYGWPANRDSLAPNPELADLNHKGATEFPEHIDKYLKKEIDNGRMLGPFTEIPFKTRIGVSPLSSRPKRGNIQDRRIIVDFSWPIGSAVNDAIDKDRYMETKIDLRYPTVDTLARRIVGIGAGSSCF